MNGKKAASGISPRTRKWMWSGMKLQTREKKWRSSHVHTNSARTHSTAFESTKASLAFVDTARNEVLVFADVVERLQTGGTALLRHSAAECMDGASECRAIVSGARSAER